MYDENKNMGPSTNVMFGAIFKLCTNMLAGIWDQNYSVVGLKKEMDRKVDDNGGESEKNNT